MIPLHDHNPTQRRAILVPALIAINVVVFLFVQPTFVNQDRREGVIETESFFACRAAIPYEITHAENLRRAVPDDPGAFDRRAQVDAILQGDRCPRKNVWLSILTSMFLHGGWLHIAGNMLYLWVFGNNIEDRLGRVRFILFYLLCGVAATYAQSYVDPSSTVPMIGASGAIAGVLGAYLLMFPRARIVTLVIFFFITTMELPALIVLGAWFVLQLFQSVGGVAPGGGVAYMAHVGGFLAGMLLLLVLRPRRPRPAPFLEP